MRTNPWAKALGLFVVIGILLAPQVLAQNPTGSLIGNVSDTEGGSLPGVTITVTSPNLQGTRNTQSGANGDYKLGFLPPGEYKATYELEGFSTTIRTIKLSAAQTSISDIEMGLSEVVEEIVVTSQLDTISATNTLATTYTQDEIEKLAIGRTINDAVSLAPGTHSTAPAAGAAITINGAMSFENLWMVNGVVINENVRGGSLPLFIEDAVQETTTTTAGISAEYGRFTGGVVNVITKSGGNQFSGSIRANLTNDDWVSNNARERVFEGDADPRTDDINQIYEATLGGPIWKDRIWFFAAGRDNESSGTGTTILTGIGFGTTDAETRVEGKLTVGITPSHSVIGSYLEIERTRSGSTFGAVLDLNSLNDRTDPQEINSVNYTGILTSSFFVEAQYSERQLVIGKGFGGPGPGPTRSIETLIPGTLLRHRPTGRRFHSSTFCGSCEDEQRDNENTLVKGSYFLTTENNGSHDFAFGYDTYTDIRFSINHQSGSDFQVWAEDIVIDGSNNIYPVFETSRTWVVFWPPFNLDIAKPTDFTTNSLYANDSWQLNENWSFNIGVRYDANDGTDSGGTKTVDDTKFSPRLGASWDIHGDGDMVFNASYGTYVAAIANTRADSTSQGGALGGFGSFYGGPAVNTNCQTDGTNCVSTEDALRVLYDWYVGGGGTLQLPPFEGGVTFPNLIFGCVPGATSGIPDTLKSPSADEFTVGITKRLGSKGLFRGDVVIRSWEDFYSNQTSLQTGTVSTPAGILDFTEVGNFGDAFLERDYYGVNLQGRYRLTDKFTFAGNYTWSQLIGNINGESPGSGPVPSSPQNYPEYSELSWSQPTGFLLADQRHKIRAWVVYDILDTERHSLNASILQNFFSGVPYSAVGAVDTTAGSLTGDHIAASCPACVAPIVEGVGGGYATPPATSTYFLSGGRDTFRTDDFTRTDLSLNYAFRWNAFGKSMEVFIQPEVLNIFDEDDSTAVNGTVRDFSNGGACPNGDEFGNCRDFNAFTETPIEGVHWVKGPDFGQPTTEGSVQRPRTWRFSVGFRF